MYAQFFLMWETIQNIYQKEEISLQLHQIEPITQFPKLPI
jgi:hypothetical protein